MSRGSIGKGKDGVYYFYIRYEDKNGAIRQKKMRSRYWTKSDAENELDKFISSLAEYHKNMDMTVGDLYLIYESYSKNFQKLRTITTHKDIYKNHIAATMNDVVITSISPRDILRWQDELRLKDLSNNYLKSIQSFFRTLLNWGVKYEYVRKNPFTQDFIRSAKKTKTEVIIWSTNDFKRFISYVDDITYHAFFLTCYWTGLRKGEAQALTIEDIDFEKSRIKINKTWDVRNQVTTTPKTTNSVRTVYMQTELKTELKKLVAQHKRSVGYTEDCLLFGFNTHLHQTSIDRHKNNACVKAGIKIIRMHDFRHSHVSLLVDMGFTPVEIADRLGHSVEMVNNIYSHLFVGSQKRMAEKLEEASIKAQEDAELLAKKA